MSKIALTAASRWQEVSTDAPRPSAEWIIVRVDVLLAHYFRPNNSEEIDMLVMADWIDALCDLPQAAIEQAIDEWVRNEDRRPTPAAIRKRALARVVKPETRKDDDRPFAPLNFTQDELERRRRFVEEMAEVFPDLVKNAQPLPGDE